jgi:hypothetical protein
MSGHPPFGVQIMLNGHEWVERQARAQAISLEKEGNCFVGGSFQALDQLADTLCDEHAIGRLAKVCDRWVYSSCLCFALTIEEQERRPLPVAATSVYQIEYSRNLLFVRGTTLDAVFQGLIDRTRRLLDVPILRTAVRPQTTPPLAYRQKPRRGSYRRSVGLRSDGVQGAFRRADAETLRQGARVCCAPRPSPTTPRNCAAGVRWRNSRSWLAKLQHMAIDFLNAMQAAHVSFLPDGVLGLPHRTDRAAAIAACPALICKSRACARSPKPSCTLAPNPDGFTVQELADEVRPSLPEVSRDAYTGRQAAYDLMKLRGKCLIERIAKTRRYRPRPTGDQYSRRCAHPPGRKSSNRSRRRRDTTPRTTTEKHPGP